jgi:NADPH:quinone reductase-like Zn-dependent oxidoreductase
MRRLLINAKNESARLITTNKINLNKNSNKCEYLVKVLYSSINPADFGFMANVYGRYKYDKYPKPLGFEGCGIIQDTTNNTKDLLGKKIVFTSNYENEKY